jgi:hypothetical protein
MLEMSRQSFFFAAANALNEDSVRQERQGVLSHGTARRADTCEHARRIPREIKGN